MHASEIGDGPADVTDRMMEDPPAYVWPHSLLTTFLLD